MEPHPQVLSVNQAFDHIHPVVGLGKDVDKPGGDEVSWAQASTVAMGVNDLVNDFSNAHSFQVMEKQRYVVHP